MKASLFLCLIMAANVLSAQQLRTVIRTNRQGQTVRLTVDENRRIIRQEIVTPRPVQAQPLRRRQPQQYPNQAQKGPEPAYVPQYQEQPPMQAPEAPEEAYPQQNTPIQTEQSQNAYHLVGFSVDFLLQSGQGLSRFSTQLDPANINSIYAGDLPSWGVGNARVGISVGFNYAYVSRKFVAFLFQMHFDSTGWGMGGLNFGLGMKFPVHPKFTLAIDSYFCFGFTGAALPSLVGVALPSGNPQSMTAILALFGFKGRIALEFPLPKNTYISLSLSYAAYPWGVSSAKGTFSVNNIALGSALVADAFKVGVEFGWKIGAKAR